MLLASNGDFYGIHLYEPVSCPGCGKGGIYEFNPKTLTVENKVLYNCYELILGNNDIIYGVGQPWGASKTSLFKYDITSNTITTIVDFNYAIGKNSSNIIQGSDGKIYGTTPLGGIFGYGVLYQYDPATDKFAVIHDFENNYWGKGKLVEGSDHTLYKLQHFCAEINSSSEQRMDIFKYNINNKEFSQTSVPFDVFSSDEISGASTAYLKIIESSNGVFYGTMSSPKGACAIFKFESNTNQFSIVHRFESGYIGTAPHLILKANNGKIYGFRNGNSNGGTDFFEFDPLTNVVRNTFEFLNTAQSSSPNPYCLIELPKPTQLSIQYRNITLEKIYSPIACDAVIGATNYSWKFTSGTEVITYETTTTSNLLNPAEAGIKFNTQYSVEVRAKINNIWGAYGEAFQITTPQTIPTSKLLTAYCGITIKALTESIKCIATSGATQYEYTFIDNVSGKKIVMKNLSTLRLDKVATLEYGRTYTVTVRPVFYNSYGNSDGACTITTPATIPPTRLSEAYRNTTLTALNNTIYCDKLPCVSDYQWEVTDAVTGKPLVKLRGNSSNSFQLSMINGIDYGRTYNIRLKEFQVL
ncbi:MAG: hypothetical protein IPO21_17620 [Bacteroidales bacterium]|nr:hypothetical protein [Bacteroidales bacterium]